MKELWKVSKWAAIVLLGAGLLFAGCVGSDSSSSSSSSPSSEDDPVPVGPGENTFLVQVDPLGEEVFIAPVSLGAAETVIDGHLVELTSNGSCVWNGTDTLTCQLELINHDTDEIMLTTQTHTGNCSSAGTECANATLADADYPTQGAQPIDGVLAGFCYTENGWDSNSSPMANPEDCPTETIGGVQFAMTFIGANGGSVTKEWEFYSTETGQYQFFTDITGTAWEPEDALGDSRYDFENYSTYVLKFYNNDNLNPGACALTLGRGYKVGTPWCSTPTNVDAVGAGTTVHLNVGIEYADHLESGQVAVWTAYDGNPSGGAAENYEYVSVAHVEVVYDPAVITHGGSGLEFAGVVCTPGTARNPFSCNYPDAWYKDFWTEFAQYTTSPADNRINTINLMNLSSFTFWTWTTWLYTPSQFQFCRLLNNNWPRNAGQIGVLEFTNFSSLVTLDCVANAVVDSDLDMWVAHIPFAVTGAAGDYTTVKLVQATNSNVNIYHSNGTAAGGPPGNDITGGVLGWCYSDIAGDDFFTNPANPPCDINPLAACGALEHHHVSRSLERTNCALPPSWGSSRADCAGGSGTCGGKQDLRTHILVQ